MLRILIPIAALAVLGPSVIWVAWVLIDPVRSVSIEADVRPDHIAATAGFGVLTRDAGVSGLSGIVLADTDPIFAADLVIGFEFTDHPSLEAAWNQLLNLAESGEPADPARAFGRLGSWQSEHVLQRLSCGPDYSESIQRISTSSLDVVFFRCRPGAPSPSRSIVVVLIALSESDAEQTLGTPPQRLRQLVGERRTCEMRFERSPTN
jgi:hypothetical protein